MVFLSHDYICSCSFIMLYLLVYWHISSCSHHQHQHHHADIIIRARETRVTGVFCHIMIGIITLGLPLPLQYIPVPVLYAVFLFMALTALDGNSFWDRIILLFTQQVSQIPIIINSNDDDNSNKHHHHQHHHNQLGNDHASPLLDSVFTLHSVHCIIQFQNVYGITRCVF